MIIKLSDYIMEQEVSEAQVSDITFEQAVAEFEVSLALAQAYAKQITMETYVMEAEGTEATTTKKEGKLKTFFRTIGNAIAGFFRIIGEKLKAFWGWITRKGKSTEKAVEAVENSDERTQIEVLSAIVRDLSTYSYEAGSGTSAASYPMAVVGGKIPKADWKPAKGAKMADVSGTVDPMAIADVADKLFDVEFLREYITSIEEDVKKCHQVFSNFMAAYPSAYSTGTGKANTVRLNDVINTYADQLADSISKLIHSSASISGDLKTVKETRRGVSPKEAVHSMKNFVQAVNSDGWKNRVNTVKKLTDEMISMTNRIFHDLEKDAPNVSRDDENSVGSALKPFWTVMNMMTKAADSVKKSINLPLKYVTTIEKAITSVKSREQKMREKGTKFKTAPGEAEGAPTNRSHSKTNRMSDSYEAADNK